MSGRLFRTASFRLLRMVAGAALIAAPACDRTVPPPAGDTNAVAAPQAAEHRPAWTGSWAPEFGDMLLVAGDADSSAIVVYPHLDADDIPQGALLDLLSTGGEVAARDVSVRGPDTLECEGAPVVRLSAGTSGTWDVGLASAAAPLRGDSLEALPRGDSARLVSALTRLASTVGAHQATRFTGLPFAVVRARGYTVGAARIVAADLVRKLPHEAAPLEEHTFIIAERALHGDSLALRFSQRSEGTEETAEHFDVLAAMAAPSAAFLLVARDNVSGTLYQILERATSGVWRVRWSRLLVC